MSITVISRPEKTLPNGFLSKWNSSELPLRYKFESDLYPINKVDTTQTITNVVYSSAKQGTVITLVTNSFIEQQFVTIDGTGIDSLDGSNYLIKEVDGDDIVIDFYTLETSNTGTALRYYRNYLGLAKVFVGAREGHPYNTDGSKPLREIATIEVDFTDDGVDNFGFANVKSSIKPDITADFDTDENSHFAWTSFYIQIAESYDDVDNGEIQNYIGPFVDDTYDTCTPFTGYVDSDFNNGLTDWLESADPSPEARSWSANVGSVSVDLAQASPASPFSQVLYQNITLINNNTYQFDLDITYAGLTSSCLVRITDSNLNVLGTKRISTTGVYSIFVTPNTDVTGVGVSIINDTNELTTLDITLNSFVATFNGSAENQCLAFNYATFGCKQFQDDLGGNFGDYVLNNTELVEPKMLTHFDELSFFYGKPFYVNAIIPASTFSQSDGGNNLFLYVQIFDENNNSLLLFNYKVENYSDGVYTVDPNIKQQLDDNNIGSCDWSYAQISFVIIPNNLFTDANNGTFEGDDVSGLTLLNTNADEVGFNLEGSNSVARTGSWSGFCSTAKVMNEVSKVYKVFESDSGLNVVQDLAYEIKAYIYIDSLEPNQLDNGSFYFIPKGYDESEVLFSSVEVKTDNIDTWVETSTLFLAKTTEEIQLEFRTAIKENINLVTGVSLYIDDITFKGPVEFISEGKTINNKCGCSFYGVNLRWKNDLNGWENWYFDKKAVFSETVTKKIDIQRDITSNWDDTFINGETQKDTIKTEANPTVLVRSQLLTENEQKVLQQIRRSVRVQMLMDSGKWQTVTIRQGTFVINDQNDKTREISFTIELPQIQIQEQ